MQLSTHFTLKQKHWLALAGLLLLFLFRLLYGLTKFSGQDEFQIYLIGLKYFTGGVFPYWGPDVVFTQTRIPGGLQGVLVGLPFWAFPKPESPYLLLNVLSFSALLFCAWYFSKRIPDLPKWFIYVWLLTAPWTLHFSTHIENPSYVLCGAVLFFVGIWELLPIYEKSLIPVKISFFLLGFSLLWVAQLHLSWVLMLPYIGLVFVFWGKGISALAKGIGFLLLGMAISGSTLVPLLVKYGWNFPGGTSQNIGVNIYSLKNAPVILLRFLSFSSYEVARFIGASYAERLTFLKENLWVVPVVCFLLVTGFLQIIWMCWSFFSPRPLKTWNHIIKFTLCTVLFVILSFCFTGVLPAAHTYYLLLPVSMWYFFYCCIPWVSHPYFKKAAMTIFAAGLFFQSTLLYHNMRRIGLYKDRAQICKAIDGRDYTMLGLRREAVFEQKQMTANTWEKTTAASGDAFEYFNGFEHYDPRFSPQNIVANEHFSGQHACKLDSIQPYCFDFHLKTEDVLPRRRVCLSCYTKLIGDTKILLVVDVKKEGERLFWDGHPVPLEVTASSTWHGVQMNIELPATLAPGGDLHLYLWCPEKKSGIAYFDEVRVKFD